MTKGWTMLFDVSGSVHLADDWGAELDAELKQRGEASADALDVLAWLDEVPAPSAVGWSFAPAESRSDARGIPEQG